jgi:hypothetical protein
MYWNHGFFAARASPMNFDGMIDVGDGGVKAGFGHGPGLAVQAEGFVAV